MSADTDSEAALRRRHGADLRALRRLSRLHSSGNASVLPTVVVLDQGRIRRLRSADCLTPPRERDARRRSVACDGRDHRGRRDVLPLLAPEAAAARGAGGCHYPGYHYHGTGAPDCPWRARRTALWLAGAAALVATAGWSASAGGRGSEEPMPQQVSMPQQEPPTRPLGRRPAGLRSGGLRQGRRQAAVDSLAGGEDYDYDYDYDYHIKDPAPPEDYDYDYDYLYAYI